MKEIRGDAKNIRSMLSGVKFSIDYYQREYRWEKKQVIELINDLCEKFLDSYDPNHDRGEVQNYGHYFLGSVIISAKENQKFIIDGQQRITTLTLLLISLHRQLPNDDKQSIASLISARKFGKHSFNLDVSERLACMNALMQGDTFDEEGQPESVVNILNRYQDIEAHLPDTLANDVKNSESKYNDALPYFADWLTENVHLVEITAYSDEDAYTIFETMNDRGLSLTPTDMLKGYLLANISDTAKRNDANDAWRSRISKLQELGKEEDADAIKSWLRSQYADQITHFEDIGSEFHRWVRSHENDLNLRESTDFFGFIFKDFNFYAKWSNFIRLRAEELEGGYEPIYYNANNNFTLQYPLLLAPLRHTDTKDEIKLKLRIVASFIDILITRHIWNGRSTAERSMRGKIFPIIMSIRGNSVDDLARILTKRLAEDTETFLHNNLFSLHQQNGPQIHRILARMTDFVETGSGKPSHYAEYNQRGNKGYEIEHIWANKYEPHTDEFSHPVEFEQYRNRIGGLLLLPKGFNASFGDKPYSEKLKHYFGQNLLAQSLHKNAYHRNPGFQKFREQHKLAFEFKPHDKFKKDDLDQRQALYQSLAQKIWDPDNLKCIANGQTP